MIVVINKITSEDEATADRVKERFEARKQLVDDRQGFLGFELWRDADEPTVLFSVSRWESRTDFEAWTNSEAFQKAHPKTGERPKMKSHVTVHDVLL